MTAPDTRVSPVFLVVTFGSAIVVGALIIYFGLHGQIGGPIP
jgi:hypothetical protein